MALGGERGPSFGLQWKDILSNSLCWAFLLGRNGLGEIWKHLQFMFTGVGAWVDGFWVVLMVSSTRFSSFCNRRLHYWRDAGVHGKTTF